MQSIKDAGATGTSARRAAVKDRSRRGVPVIGYDEIQNKVVTRYILALLAGCPKSGFFYAEYIKYCKDSSLTRFILSMQDISNNRKEE